MTPRTHEITHDEVDLSLLVRSMRWESDGVVSLELEDAGGADLPAWGPGAHLDLHLPGGATRQFSLCGPTGEQGRRVWRVAVLREPAGRGGSAAVHEQVRPGMVLAARGPRNNFVLADSPRYAFVAGGIGITPILAMAAEAQARGADWTLLYGGRTRGSMAFTGELTAYGDRVTLHPQDEAGHLPLAERLSEPREDTLVYACGPAPMLDAVTAATEHWPSGSLHLERFAAVAPTAEQVASEHAFELEAAASGVTLTVPVGVTIIQALADVGILPVTSCEEGICGTCETTVLEGAVDHRDSLLSDEERAASETMMICVSRCAGSRLVLDL